MCIICGCCLREITTETFSQNTTLGWDLLFQTISSFITPTKIKSHKTQSHFCVLCGDVVKTVCGDCEKKCKHCFCYVCPKTEKECVLLSVVWSGSETNPKIVWKGCGGEDKTNIIVERRMR